MTAKHRPHIVVLGAGFAGTGVVKELTKLFQPEECEITIVDENNFLLFTPMLTEAAGGLVDAPDVVAPVRSLQPLWVNFDQGKVQSLDPEGRRVTLTVGGPYFGIPAVQKELTYDYLVICLGSITNYHHIPGLKEHSLAAKTIQDAIAIRNRCIALLDRADEETDAEQRRAFLSFVVGGGGFSGVETIGAINDMVRELARSHQHILPGEVQMTLVHPGDRVLPELSKDLAEYTQRELEQRGVRIMLDTKVSGAGDQWVEVQGKNDQQPQRIPCYTLIWTGGVKPTPVIDESSLKTGKHGGIVVDACCQVPDHDRIWALGDCAEIPKPGGKETYAPTAQNAIREGKIVARNVAAAIRSESQKPFVYTPVGELAVIGKRAGVASLYGFHFSGIVAWAMWRAIYLAKHPGFTQRLRVLLDWTLDAIFGRDIAEIPGINPSER